MAKNLEKEPMSLTEKSLWGGLTGTAIGISLMAYGFSNIPEYPGMPQTVKDYRKLTSQIDSLPELTNLDSTTSSAKINDLTTLTDKRETLKSQEGFSKTFSTFQSYESGRDFYGFLGLAGNLILMASAGIGAYYVLKDKDHKRRI